MNVKLCPYPMSAALFAQILLAAVFINLLLQLWLDQRQIRHIRHHRNQVPEAFDQHITLDEHQKAADYNCAKTRLGMFAILLDTAFLLLLTLGGLLHGLIMQIHQWLPDDGYPGALALIAGVMLLGWLIHLPMDIYRNFKLEARYGFNRQTAALYVQDLCKQAVLALIIGTPLLLAILWLMNRMGALWWLYVWVFWMGFNLLALLLYPTLIAPLFNKFEPLAEGELKNRIVALLNRCGFHSSGLFVMDGSRRSSHGNAYFTGFGKAKRIVFFDTLIERLQPAEIDAVLAHELGHYRHHHILQRIVLLAILTLVFFALLGQLLPATWFYAGLGVPLEASLSATSDMATTPLTTALALTLFTLILPSFSFPLTPLMSWHSRQHEFQADAYAATHSSAHELISALAKLYRDNASTLTPDPLHSLFHDTHPPASLRIRHLQELPS